MKIKNIVTAVCALTVIQLLNISVSEARGSFDFGSFQFRIASSGTFISTPIDTNSDGIPASISMLTGRGKPFGPVTSEILTEGQILFDIGGNPVPCETPDGKPGILNGLVQASGVYRLWNGDQIFTEAVSVDTCTDAAACFDEQGNVKKGCLFYGLAKGIITGGTGRFACASGSVEDTSNGLALVVDPKNQFFGAILESDVHGEISIARHCDTPSPGSVPLPR